jgi:hypothetical protein
MKQVKNIVAVVEDKIENLNKTKTKNSAKYKRNIQDLWNTIKRPNLQITDIEEVDAVQVKGIDKYSIK